jgi:hypothetical protein
MRRSGKEVREKSRIAAHPREAAVELRPLCEDHVAGALERLRKVASGYLHLRPAPLDRRDDRAPH